jgi:hypothetical protein
LNTRKEYRVLCLSRSIFIEDVKAMASKSNDIQYFYFNKNLLGMAVERFLPQPELNEKNYHIDTRYDEGKEKLFTFVSDVFKVLHRHLKFDAVMSGNFGYVDQQEFFRICRLNQIPAIVLYKEGMTVSSFYDTVAEHYKSKMFLADKILFYNEDIRKNMMRGNINGLKEEKTASVGIPRLDNYISAPQSKTKHIVFFSFVPNEKFSYMTEDDKILKIAKKRSEDFHKHVFQFALKHPDWQITVKTKRARHYARYAKEVMRKHYGDGKIKNVKITRKDNTTGLIKSASIVVGFNSLTLIEAIMADRLVISPYFGDLFEGAWDYFYHFPEFVNYAEDYQALEMIILNKKQLKRPSADQKRRFLDPMIYKADGKACRRAEKEIIHTIRQFQNKKRLDTPSN